MHLLIPLWTAAAAVMASPPPPSADGPRLTARQLDPTSIYREPPLRNLDVDPVPWREANDRVRALGGHAGHLRGAAGAAPARQAPLAPKDKP